MSKTQAGRRWYEAFAESDAPVGWTAWKDLDTPSKARYARAEKAYLAKLLDAEGKVVVTQEAAAAIGSAKRKSTVLKAEDINTFTDAETELEAIKQLLDESTTGEGTTLERVIGIRRALTKMHDRCKQTEEELAKVTKEFGSLGLEGNAEPGVATPTASDRARWFMRERIHLMREAVQKDLEGDARGRSVMSSPGKPRLEWVQSVDGCLYADTTILSVNGAPVVRMEVFLRHDDDGEVTTRVYVAGSGQRLQQYTATPPTTPWTAIPDEILVSAEDAASAYLRVEMKLPHAAGLDVGVFLDDWLAEMQKAPEMYGGREAVELQALLLVELEAVDRVPAFRATRGVVDIYNAELDRFVGGNPGALFMRVTPDDRRDFGALLVTVVNATRKRIAAMATTEGARS